MNTSTIIETNAGKIQGYSENGIKIFKGIPYAEPPIGDLRFRPSVPKAPWPDTLDCTQFGPIAPQRTDAFIGSDPEAKQSEKDCLSLNVWTPATDDKRRPVLFWIHGGGFSFGSGSRQDGSHLARRNDVVVVTINYRVGIFGYLCVPGEIANLGQLDQITALEWVRNNIEFFGGDPDKVTIFGESAGGVAVCTLMGMPGAKGLFKRVISQSGACHPLRHQASSGKGTEVILSELGLKDFNMKTLQEIPTKKIVEVGRKLELEARQKGRNFPYGIYVDEKTLPKHPLEAVREGFTKDLDLMVGTNQDEAKLYTAMIPPEKETDEEGLIRAVHRIIKFRGKDENDAKHLITVYRKTREGKLPTDPQNILDAFMTDFRFRISALRLAEAQVKHQPNVFSYLFTYRTPALGGKLGACHGLEIPFVFGMLPDSERKIYPARSKETDILSGKMMGAWASFAKNGNPSHKDIPTWKPYDLAKRKTMLFGKDVSVADDPFGPEREVWEGII